MLTHNWLTSNEMLAAYNCVFLRLEFIPLNCSKPQSALWLHSWYCIELNASISCFLSVSGSAVESTTRVDHGFPRG